MRREERREKAFERGNLLDLFLILLLLFCVIGAGLRQRALQNGREDFLTQEYSVILLLEKQPSDWLDCVEIGETLYLPDGTPFGSLRAISPSPCQELLPSADGTHVVWEDGTLLDVRAEILVRGHIRDDVFLREEGQALLLWSRQTFYSERAEWKVTVIKISPSA